MASIKLKHSGGNGVIIAAPTSNPASDKTLTLPSDVDGTVVSKDSSNSLQNIAGINGGQLGNRRININGALNLAQRGTSFSSTSGGNYFADRYKVGFNTISAGTCVTSQQTLSSSDAPYDLGFRKFGRLALGQAGTAAGTSFIEVLHKFEGQDINASGWNHTSASSYITVSFWFRCSTNQTFYANLRSRDGTSQVYTFSFTATGNNTWTKITKTIPGNASVQIDNDNGAGLDCRIWIFAGTDYTASVTLDQWRAYDTASRVPDMATTWLTAGASTIDFTGFQFEAGSSATDFEHRSYAQELQLCKRYFQKMERAAQEVYCTGYFESNTQGRYTLTFPVDLRVDPTITFTAASTFTNIHTGSLGTGTSMTTTSTTPQTALVNCTVNSGGTDGQACLLASGVGQDSSISISAEL